MPRVSILVAVSLHGYMASQPFDNLKGRPVVDIRMPGLHHLIQRNAQHRFRNTVRSHAGNGAESRFQRHGRKREHDGGMRVHPADVLDEFIDIPLILVYGGQAENMLIFIKKPIRNPTPENRPGFLILPDLREPYGSSDRISDFRISMQIGCFLKYEWGLSVDSPLFAAFQAQ